MDFMTIGTIITGILLFGIPVAWFIYSLTHAHIDSNYRATREYRDQQQQNGGSSAQYATGRSMSRADEDAWCEYMKDHLRDQGFSEQAIERAADQGRLAAVSGMFHDATPAEMPESQPAEMPIRVDNWPVWRK